MQTLSRIWVGFCFGLSVAFSSSSALPAHAQSHQLLMIEADHCVYCMIFNRDVAPIYDQSPEGKIAPLVHVQLRGPIPEGVTLKSRPLGTPTFILVGPDGVEIDRMFGYQGEDFFWGYLGRMLERAGIDPMAAG